MGSLTRRRIIGRGGYFGRFSRAGGRDKEHRYSGYTLMVAFLSFPDGEPFATGMAEYSYQPATPEESLPRLILNIKIEGISTSAILDTGAPYVICAPTVARRIGLTPQASIGKIRLIIRGVSIDGHLHRLTIRFVALYGVDTEVDATALVPGLE